MLPAHFCSGFGGIFSYHWGRPHWLLGFSDGLFLQPKKGLSLRGGQEAGTTLPCKDRRLHGLSRFSPSRG